MRAIGTTAVVVVTDPDGADDALALLAEDLHALDEACSRFRPDSELRRVERISAGRPVAVSPLLFEVVEVACAVAVQTAGIVDPTVGTALIELGYDRDFDDIGIRHHGRPRRRRCRRRGGGGSSSTGATAQWRSLRGSISTSAPRPRPGPPTGPQAASPSTLGCGTLVNLGGDVAMAGPAPTGGWTVGIAPDCSTPLDAVDQVVAVHGGGLATSGTTARSWVRNGRVVHHIVDPWTGEPAAPVWSLVSTTAPTCVEANAWSTAAVVWGHDAVGALSDVGVPARLVDDGGVHRAASPRASADWPGGAVMLATSSTTLWYTTRATGIVALVLLTMALAFGILTAGRVRSRSWPAVMQSELHKRVSIMAMVFLALHVLTAVLDTYVHLGWASIVVPFSSSYQPLWTGLGAVAVDLMIAVAVSSALRQRISARTWRGIHWLAYGSWPVAMAHALGEGTDGFKLWMDVVAGLCTLAVGSAVAWRIVDHRSSRERAALVGARTRAVPDSSGPGPVRAGRVPTGSRPERPTTAGDLLTRERP